MVNTVLPLFLCTRECNCKICLDQGCPRKGPDLNVLVDFSINICFGSNIMCWELAMLSLGQSWGGILSSSTISLSRHIYFLTKYFINLGGWKNRRKLFLFLISFLHVYFLCSIFKLHNQNTIQNTLNYDDVLGLSLLYKTLNKGHMKRNILIKSFNRHSIMKLKN